MLKELPRACVYKIAPELNPGKRAALGALHQEWQRTLPLAFKWYWTPFLKGGLLPRNPPRSGPRSTFPATTLSTSPKDLMAVAIEGQAKGWASNLANRITRGVMAERQLLQNPTLRRQLLWINAMRAWLLPYREQVSLLAGMPAKKDPLPGLTLEASRLMRKLVRNYLGRKRLPDPLQLPMQVNQLSAVMAPKTQSKSFWANRWVRISALERGKRIELPVMANPFAQAKGGREATTFSLYPKGDDWFVRATQYVAPTPWADNRVDALAIDLGLRTLMASSEGDLLGVGFLDQLRRYDDQLIRLQQGLQGAGHLRLASCKRYRALVERLRGFLKTTVQTHLGTLLARHQPKKVVIEDLLFAGTHGELSRRMNRLLRRFGQRYFTQTLEEKQAEYGFVLERVEPAYTSQTCPRCGFVHSENRSKDLFLCLACGHRAHADVNAAKNQCRRSALSATPRPGNRHGWRVQSLQHWAARLRASLAKQDISGLPPQHRAVGCARAGLRALAQRKNSARGLSSGIRQELLQAALAPTTEGLLKGLAWVEVQYV